MMRLPVLAVPLAFFAPAASAKDVPFTLVNATSSTVREFYLSLPGEMNWGPNRLTASLPAGASIPATIQGAETCIFDVRTVFDDEVETEDRSFDLCEIQEYRIEEDAEE